MSRTDGDARRRGGLGLLVLLPVLCCGAPLLVAGAAGLAAWAGLHAGVLGGIGGGVLVALVTMAVMVRRSRSVGCGPAMARAVGTGAVTWVRSVPEKSWR